jgi:hypothetical protein
MLALEPAEGCVGLAESRHLTSDTGPSKIRFIADL